MSKVALAASLGLLLFFTYLTAIRPAYAFAYALCLLFVLAWAWPRLAIRGMKFARRLDPVLAGPLGLVHGRIGSRKELQSRPGRGSRGDPEAGRHRNRGAVHGQNDLAGEAHPDPFGQLGATREIGSGEDEDELLPTPAPGEVDVSDRLL